MLATRNDTDLLGRFNALAKSCRLSIDHYESGDWEVVIARPGQRDELRVEGRDMLDVVVQTLNRAEDRG